MKMSIFVPFSTRSTLLGSVDDPTRAPYLSEREITETSSLTSAISPSVSVRVQTYKSSVVGLDTKVGNCTAGDHSRVRSNWIGVPKGIRD